MFVLKIASTGSCGNGYALVSDEEILLVECGVPLIQMKKLINFQTSKVVGCLISHEHG